MRPNELRPLCRATNAAALAALIAVLPAAAWCGQFACKAPDGATVYRDVPPPECGDVEIRELNSDGSMRRLIEPPLTVEQRRQNEERQRRQDECRRKNQDQDRKDASLLGTYPNEQELAAARIHALANGKALIDQQNRKLKELKAERRHLDDEAEFHPKGPLADELQRKLDDNSALQNQAQRAIDRFLADMERTNDRFDADLARYRELVSGKASRPLDCSEA